MIMPNVRRSRASCRTSLLVIARGGAASRLRRRAGSSARGRSRSRPRTRPRGWRAPVSRARRRRAARRRCATRSAGSRVAGSSSTCSRVPSCATLSTAASCASARARGDRVRRLDLDHVRRDLRHQLLRRALRDDAAAREDRQFVAALGLVHVVRRHQDRHAARHQREQALPEVAPALRIDGAGGLVEQQQFGFVQRRRRQRQPLALPAAQRAGALREQRTQAELRRHGGDPLRAGAAAARPNTCAMNSRFSRTVRSSHSENFCVM